MGNPRNGAAKSGERLLADATGKVETRNRTTKSKLQQQTSKKTRKQQRTETHQKVWTARRRKAVETHIAYLQDVLQLNDWTVTYKWDQPCGTDALATVTPMGDSRHVRLQLSPEFLKLEPEMQHQTLVHEMVHCHFFTLIELAQLSFETVAVAKAAAVFNVALDRQHELAVDSLADAFARLVTRFDLPPLTATERKLVDSVER